MIDALRRWSPGALALSVAAALFGCQQRELLVPKIPGLEPYRITIQQGNYISQEMVAQLKLGMTRDQVRFVLGTPLVQDAFHADRWDYVFYREVPGGKREQRNLAVVFEKDRLARVIGDLVPPEGAAPQPTGFVPLAKPDAPAKPAPAAPKPPAETASSTAEPARPGFDLARPSGEPAKPPAAAAPEPPAQNWRAASDEPEKPPEPAAEPEKKAEEKKGDEKKAEEPSEPGFFGRLRQKLGL